MRKIYVGNLSYRTTDDTMRELFARYGEVATAATVLDRETGKSRGFGFVEMPNDTEADAAIEALNGTDFEGRKLTVNIARPRAPRPEGGFGGGGYDNDRGGGGGGRDNYSGRGGGGGGGGRDSGRGRRDDRW